MKKIILLGFMMIFWAIPISAQTQKCFVNAGLKDKHIVYLNIEGANVKGEFIIEKDYESATTYNFSGTNLNNNLSINFANAKAPYQFPPKAKKGVWKLKKVGDEETLAIKIYGKNYETNKYSAYFATYEPCEPSYESLAKKAQRVSFTSGATSATVTVTLAGEADKKSFWLKLGKGQKFYIEAPGCAIAIYYPDKTADSEGAIDTWGSDSLPQGGDYLLVFSAAGVPGTRTLKFSTK